MGSHASSAKLAKNELHVALDALRQIVRALRLTSNIAEKSHGVSGAQLFVLQTLGEGPASSITELAARTVTDPSSVSVVVKKLTEQGLVARRRSKRDARRAEIFLSAKGKVIVRGTPQVAQTLLIDAFASLSPSIRRSLSHGLVQLVRRMGKSLEEPVLFFEDENVSESSVLPRSTKRGRRAIS